MPFFYRGGELSLEWEAFARQGWAITLLILVDFVRVIFLSTVLLISGGVILYRSCYMGGDKFSSRFGLIVLRFVGRIRLLILRPNIIRLLLGWDGLGVTSYLLVCYYSREKRFNARMLTALTNRLGDVAVLLRIGFISGRSEYMYGLISGSNCAPPGLWFGLILIAAMTKSAQIPFSSWLPAAMAAPTPVSALVHSSTLVTAGVYLLIRFNYFIVMRDYAWVILMLGLVTITMAGGAALFELDIKKVIALSTLRQLGVIFFRLGLGQTFLAFFHLISHAYFKAMLFIAAGAIIHSVKDYQDLRKIGSNSRNLVVLASVILVANLRLCGMPFLSGFYSKDVILEIMIFKGGRVPAVRLMLLATGLTLMYSVRLSLGLFGGGAKRERLRSEVEVRATIFIGMGVLILPSIIGGWWLSGVSRFRPIIWLPLWQKLIILCLIILLGVWLLSRGVMFRPRSFLAKVAHQMWFMPLIFRPVAGLGALKRGKLIFKITDRT